MTGSIRILIADDNQSDRMILSRIVQKQGHIVETAENGREAVNAFKSFRPDIVLLDALMPEMDGFEAAREIKSLAGEDLVPIIFLTSLSDVDSLVRCLEAGGDDFLSKPYNRVILEAKINAFYRMRTMNHQLIAQRNTIAEHNRHMVQEQEVARRVFDNVAHLGCLGARNIRHLLSPLSVFNGDVLLACQRPSGGMHVLLGDFTGHGLPAAIGAMPLAEIFYGMTVKGFSLTDILREINQKLKKILPVGFFCCACMAELNFDQKTLEVWIGGLPDAVLVQNGRVIRIPPNHPPLGVLRPEQFQVKTYRYEMADGDRLFMWSDGILEAANPQGQMYGEARLLDLMQSHSRAPDLFDRLLNSVFEFVGSNDQQDDLTLVEVTMMPETDLGIGEAHLVRSALKGPRTWDFRYRVEGDTLRDFNPIPLLLHVIMEVPELRPYNGQIYTILTELYSNALEHGILGLSSGLKHTPDGFARYYKEREARLSRLEGHWIEFFMSHEMAGKGGVLKLGLKDSGSGFDTSAIRDIQPAADRFAGRGIPLLRTLCRKLEYSEGGTRVQAEFVWPDNRKPA
ncbi:MAG: response regulator [Gammaproteobacteria bacterium]|nr:MAG: response regulator [Gammaproteobacteria bacterium]